jgi:GH3 auxin-responsive promoter
VIARGAAALLEWYLPRRRRALERVARQAGAVQEATLLSLVRRARDTDFGFAHGFDAIRTVADYQSRVPVADYLAFRPWWTRALQGERHLTWPDRPRYWVKTSGTTAGDKVLPITPEAFASHRRGGWDSLLIAVERTGASALLGGSLLFPGGSSALQPIGEGGLIGDLSGLVVRRLPPVIRRHYSPGPAISAIADWETRIEAVAALAARQDVRLLCGRPWWVLVLFDRIARRRALEGRPIASVGECWPNLEVFVHGGVAFAPYRGLFEHWMGRPVQRVEVYPASEAFVALQTEREGGLTLMLDYGVFYEFIPVEEVGAPSPRRHTVADLELGRAYAVALTSPAGLWSYLLGDTVRFVARDPLRLEITGRTRHFVNAFGENVIVEEVERAIVVACQRAHAEVVEFTVAPRYPSTEEPRGGHDWLVEFAEPPRCPLDVFTAALDETLGKLNTDYRTKRAAGVGMVEPRLVELPAGTFYHWMRGQGKLGDQHKVPRVTNSRAVADGLLASAAIKLEGAGAAPSKPPHFARGATTRPWTCVCQ